MTSLFRPPPLEDILFLALCRVGKNAPPEEVKREVDRAYAAHYEFIALIAGHTRVLRVEDYIDQPNK